jgi:tRNA(fMet)-specific endonuclease VapC
VAGRLAVSIWIAGPEVQGRRWDSRLLEPSGSLTLSVVRRGPASAPIYSGVLDRRRPEGQRPLGELHYGAEKSARRVENLTAIAHFVAWLEVLPFADKAAAHYGQVRAELERPGTPCGPHDMQIGGHARSEGLIVVTKNMREFARMPGVRAENWV